MARVTVEDCVKKIPNRFELVAIASQRARNISSGGSITVERDNDKNPVVALREIAEGTVTLDELKESLISSLKTRVETDDPEEDDIDLLGIQEELGIEEISEKVIVAEIGSDVEEETEKTSGQI